MARENPWSPDFCICCLNAPTTITPSTPQIFAHLITCCWGSSKHSSSSVLLQNIQKFNRTSPKTVWGLQLLINSDAEHQDFVSPHPMNVVFKKMVYQMVYQSYLQNWSLGPRVSHLPPKQHKAQEFLGSGSLHGMFSEKEPIAHHHGNVNCIR